MASAIIQVPNDAISFGSACSSNDREFLQVQFFTNTNNSWLFDINIFKSGKTLKNVKLSTDDDVTYSWKNVGLTYHMDSHFTDAKDQSGNQFVVR